MAHHWEVASAAHPAKVRNGKSRGALLTISISFPTIFHFDKAAYTSITIIHCTPTHPDFGARRTIALPPNTSFSNPQPPKEDCPIEHCNTPLATRTDPLTSTH